MEDAKLEEGKFTGRFGIQTTKHQSEQLRDRDNEAFKKHSTLRV